MITRPNEERFRNPLPERPANFWEVLRWLYEEPLALKKFEVSLDRKERYRFRVKNLLPLLGFASLLSITIWVLGWGLVLSMYSPSSYYFPRILSEAIQMIAQADLPFSDRWLGLLVVTLQNFLLGLSLGLIIGFIYGLAGGLTLGVTIGVVGGLAGGFGGLLFGISFGFVFGLAFGLAIDFFVWLALPLMFSLTLSLVLDFGGVPKLDFAVALAFFLMYILVQGLATISPIYWLVATMFYRTYPPEVLIAKRGRFWLVSPVQKQVLIEKAKQNFEWALDFTSFLQSNRLRLRHLAALLMHKATSAAWKRHPLTAEVFEMPVISNRLRFFFVNDRIIEHLERIKTILITIGQEQNHIQRAKGYRDLILQLRIFKAAFIVSTGNRFSWWRPKTWAQDYVDALEVWIQEAEGRAHILDQEIRNRLPFGENPYVIGKALTPSNGSDVFRGRKSVTDDLARRITGSRELPMLLIQGQRRVGKTSLVNFLETLLDQRFLVVKQDMQQGGCDSIAGWMQDLRQKFNFAFNIRETNVWHPEGRWAKDWEELSHYFLRLAEQREVRVILALDEYERLHTLTQQLSATDSKNLLEAMRSFTQHQNRVVLLFVGLLDFSDLRAPDWTGIFV